MNMQSRDLTMPAQLITELGQGALHLVKFDGEDHVDGLFHWVISAETTGADDVALDTLLGTHATVVLPDTQYGERAFDGIVTHAAKTGIAAGRAQIRLTLEPWFSLLSQRQNQRIFHEMDVEGILRKLFADYASLGAPAVAFQLNGDHPVLEYSVQYQESDLAFARRMMERFGLSFFFRHDIGSHTLVITDTMDQFDQAPGGARPFRHGDAGHQDYEERFWAWSQARQVGAGQVRLTDFNFHQPNAAMEVDRGSNAARGRLETVQYPGNYRGATEGQAMAATMLRQAVGQDHRHNAAGDCVSISAGMRMRLETDEAGLGGEYLCLSVRQSYRNPLGRSAADDAEPMYRADYDFTPISAPYAPPAITPLAKVHGPQTARVVGEGEIDCDDLGRILVRFHWDLEAEISMRCRVSQSWAGNGFGGMIIPRVGMEVVVEFLDGDPDRPLVTGCVYNGRNAVPDDLPNRKTRSLFRTETVKGQGFNALRFDDEAAGEEIYFHAQRDMNIKVHNTATARVDVNKLDSVGHNRGVEVGNNDIEVVAGDKTIRVGASHQGAFGADSADVEGIGAAGQALGKPGQSLGEGHYDLTVDGQRHARVGQCDRLDVAQDRISTVGRDQTVQVQRKLVLEAGDQIIFKCGAAEIEMCKNGTLRINGKALNVEMGGMIKMLSDMIKLN